MDSIKNQGQTALVFVFSSMAGETPKKAWYVDSLQLFSKLSGWVLVPLFTAVLTGHYLDAKHNTNSKWFFISVGIAFIVSTIGLVTQASKEYKKIISKEKK